MPAVRIVCIEDDPQIIELVRTILGRKGYQVIGAAGGQEGLTLVQVQRPDLILLDLMMPDLDGWEVYRRLKEDPLLAPVPVMVVTARAQDIDRVLGLHVAHVDDYLTKPFTPKQLTDSVERILARRHAATEPARVFATVFSTRPVSASATTTVTGLGRVAYQTAAETPAAMTTRMPNRVSSRRVRPAPRESRARLRPTDRHRQCGR